MQVPNDQNEAPILEAMAKFLEKESTAFGVPGHQSGKGAADDVKQLIGEAAFKADCTPLKGLDDRRERQRVRQRAERLAAQAWGADHCFFSSNGSSLSNHAALLCVAAPGDKVLVQRSSHKSVLAALLVTGVEPVWLEPEFDEEWGISHGVPVGEVERQLAAHPDARAVLITSPTYYGVVPDLERLAALCHQHGKPLIVDEAWGPHFPFHPEMPRHALHAGADMTLGSIHKTMAGLTQASILLLKSELIPADVFNLAFDAFETTSVNSLILASMDAARRDYATRGEELVGRTLALARQTREAISAIDGLKVMGREVLSGDARSEMDETKVLIDVGALGVTGYACDEWLTNTKNLVVELSDERRIELCFTVGHDQQSVDTLVKSLQALPAFAAGPLEDCQRWPRPLPTHAELRSEALMTPSQAFHAPSTRVPLDEAAGRIAAEMLSPYPPGIPRVFPGERITPAQVEFMRVSYELGAFALDASDLELKTVRVVA
jgi:lysine decarboxylase